ncbi:chromatin modification-related protein eaf-1 [Drosophila miranda]|uniref:chromatin modification-related protein eaf-1 n=1 Tax=Drosophila miranda TaxID=7229 RepID=UPI00143F39D8|nr:chromatin modification-related protein eaf-1 [Drosophila miranda]
MSMQPAPTGDNEYRTRQSPGILLATTRGSHWIMGLLFVHTIMSLMVVKVASTAALYQHQQQPLQPLNDIESTAETTPSDRETQSLGLNQNQSQIQSSSDIEKMRAKLQQLQHEQQQEYLRQQQQQLQLHLQQMHATGAVGETAYLLERADHVAPAPAPIYGTWRTKARRAPHATSGNDVDDGHVYERLPKRSATMTPLRGVLRDQMPRPPRLATQDTHHPQMSGSPPPPPSTSLLRRHYSETPGTLAMREDFKPKPFHFPYDGPMPEQFTKGEAEREQRPRPEVNNIQDILQHLHINGLGPSKLPPMVMMPTGLHIAGSFKNLKSSGIGNFFRSKRNKKQMQFSIPLPISMGHMPMPMPMPMSMSMPMAMPMPMQWYGPGVMSHQRVAIDQLYPYKPRSPQDINLLAMQQLTPNKNVSKKKNKKKHQNQQHQQQQQQLTQGNHNLLLEHGSQQHYVADPFGQHLPQPVLGLNATRQPLHKRIPFKLNLDIYPVMPPSRPASVLRNPFQQEYAMPSPAALTGTTAAAYQHLGPGVYQTPFKFPTQAPHPGHMQISFPDQAPRLSQQQALYQSQAHKFPPPKSVHPDEAIYGHGPAYGHSLAQGQNQGQSHWQGHSHGYPQGQGLAHVQALGQVQGQGQAMESQSIESHTSPIMLHLNVFPKQKPTATIRASTNPFYNNNLNRNTIYSSDLPPPNPPSPIEPRQAGNGSATPAATHPQHHHQQQQPSQQISLNQTQQHHQPQVNRSSSISRSDHMPLIDFEHPIVAADLPEAPHPASLVSHRTDHRHHRAQGHHPMDEHFRYQKNANIEQLAAEAQTASLFRFPVEDLIQFHVDDAL